MSSSFLEVLGSAVPLFYFQREGVQFLPYFTNLKELHLTTACTDVFDAQNYKLDQLETLHIEVCGCHTINLRTVHALRNLKILGCSKMEVLGLP